MADGCKVDSCGLPHHAGGFCQLHYGRWKRHGDPLKLSTRRRPPVIVPGERYGRLLILKEVKNTKKGRHYLCRCDCGVEVVRGTGIRRSPTPSCGCFNLEVLSHNTESQISHNHSHTGKNGGPTPTYHAWLCMRDRCCNPNNASWENYGGRGITVCDRWANSFEAFLEDMGEKPEWATGGLDRIDNWGNYEPGNCRWATIKEQNSNRRKPRTAKISEVKELRDEIKVLKSKLRTLSR